MFTKIENCKYKGFDLYIKTIIQDNLQIEFKKASIFNDLYLYFYKDKDSTIYKPLGKFQQLGKISLGLAYQDVEYEVYEFEKDKIFTNNINNIYYQFDNNIINSMTLVPDLTYNDLPVYSFFK
jgi:hypothetical protein